MDHYHIFISHAWKYSDDYQTVVKWIDEAKADGILNWSNYSVPYHDPLVDPSTTVGKNKLQKLLENQISPASKIIVISGMYAAYSDWIDFEIDTSVSKGKYIIGLKPWGQERIPVKIQNNADIMVGWNKSSVINAILGK
jgi:hypothetical protein